MPTSCQRLRGLLNRPSIIRTFAAHDVFSARVMEDAGVEMLFLGGFGASASLLGLPDIGLITLTEMAEAARRMAGTLTIPLVVDGDTGHGGLQNVARTVQEFERAGAAGMLLEDQVFPKRCGHFEGKAVIGVDEMLEKLRAAIDSRRSSDFVIVARTDARAVEGLESAIERANRFGEAGADVCFVEAPQSRQELEQIARDVAYPQLANMLPGGATPILPADDLEQMGYKIVVDPISSLLVSSFAVRRLVETMQTDGRVDTLDSLMHSFDEIKRILGVDRIEIDKAER